MGKRPFFIGVGAQRAGTTWVGHFLRSLPDVRFSPIKETCFFDSKYVEKRKDALLGSINTRLALLGLANYTRKYPISGAKLWIHYSGMRKMKDKSYRGYFDELARSGTIAGEISPSYAILNQNVIAQIETLLDQPNYFFIMRNPVDRLLSQFSFLSSRRGLDAPTGKDIEDALLNLCDASMHIDYAQSLVSYGSAVPRERFRTFYTEHLFDPRRMQNECDGLCDFLGIGQKTVHGNRAVNRAPEVEISIKTRTFLVQRLIKSYNAARTYNDTDLPESWRNDLELVGQM